MPATTAWSCWPSGCPRRHAQGRRRAGRRGARALRPRDRRARRRSKSVLTPDKLEREYGLAGGHVYHGELGARPVLRMATDHRAGPPPAGDPRALPVRLRRPSRRRPHRRTRRSRRPRHPRRPVTTPSQNSAVNKWCLAPFIHGRRRPVGRGVAGSGGRSATSSRCATARPPPNRCRRCARSPRSHRPGCAPWATAGPRCAQPPGGGTS